MAEPIAIEVAYVDTEAPVVKSYVLPAGSTVADALLALRADWNADAWIRGEREVGVFGRVARRDVVLSDGDRVELYRPLLNDPKVARRQRARAAAKRSGGS
jgi:uncharacterized protein